MKKPKKTPAAGTTENRNQHCQLILPTKTISLLRKYARFLKQGDSDELMDDICLLLVAHERFGGLVEIFGVGMSYIEGFRCPKQAQLFSGPLTEEARRQMILGILKIRPGKHLDERMAKAFFAPDTLTQKDLDSMKAYVKYVKSRAATRPRMKRLGSGKRTTAPAE